jgi:hypothetical protein
MRQTLQNVKLSFVFEGFAHEQNVLHFRKFVKTYFVLR